jgi:integrase
MPRKSTIEPVRTPGNPRGEWKVDIAKTRSASGRREKRYFPNRSQADIFCADERSRLAEFSEAARRMTGEQRLEAYRCLQICAAHGFTLTEAVDFYRERAEQAQRSILIPGLVAEVIAEKRAEGVSKKYLADLNHRLGKFAVDHRAVRASELTASGVTDWLRALGHGAISRNNYRRLIGLMLEFARHPDRRYIAANFIGDVPVAKAADVEVEAFTLEEAAALLAACDESVRPVVALGLFAGIRPEEIKRLSWSHVHWPTETTPGDIHVPGKISKTGSHRFVRIQPNLAAWLTPYQGRNGRIFGAGSDALRYRMDAVRAAAGLTRWPHDALRHSFASYHLARWNDAAALALQMGHTTTAMIFSHYRRVVKESDAARYWNIFPDLCPLPFL